MIQGESGRVMHPPALCGNRIRSAMAALEGAAPAAPVQPSTRRRQAPRERRPPALPLPHKAAPATTLSAFDTLASEKLLALETGGSSDDRDATRPAFPPSAGGSGHLQRGPSRSRAAHQSGAAERPRSPSRCLGATRGERRAAEPFLDPWVSEWSLGYPMWRSYQPLPHVLGAAWLKLAEPFASHPAAFRRALLPVARPVAGERVRRRAAPRHDHRRREPGGASRVWRRAESGDLDRYGLGYGATTWRGSGLYTQVVALHLLLLDARPRACARSTRAGGARWSQRSSWRRRRSRTSSSATSRFVSAALLALVGPRGERSRRLVRLATIAAPALVLLVWFVVPLYLSRATVNHSRWEDAFKWDSFGAPVHPRRARLRPVLRRRAAAAALAARRARRVAVAVGSIRESVPRRLLALAAALAGALLRARDVGPPAAARRRARRLPSPSAAGGVRAVGAARRGVGLEQRWSRQRRSTDALVARLRRRARRGARVDRRRARALSRGERRVGRREPRRVRARRGRSRRGARRGARRSSPSGRAACPPARPRRGASDFKVGDVPVYAFLTRAHLDQVSFLYHSMSLGSDIMVLRDEDEPVQDAAFGVRAVVAPVGQADAAASPPPRRARPFRRLRGALRGLLRPGRRRQRATPAPTRPGTSRARPGSQSPLLPQGVVAALGGDLPDVPAFGRWQPFPEPRAAHAARPHRVGDEERRELPRARFGDPALLRAGEALLASRPRRERRWRRGADLPRDARVRRRSRGGGGARGGRPLPARAPEAAALRLRRRGVRRVRLRLAARPDRPHSKSAAAVRLSTIGARLDTPRVRTAVALAALVIVATRPLFRGQLIDGHDALEYPPRLVEMDRGLRDGHVPAAVGSRPGNGHGQPLFEFAPPLVYVAAAAVPRDGAAADGRAAARARAPRRRGRGGDVRARPAIRGEPDGSARRRGGVAVRALPRARPLRARGLRRSLGSRGRADRAALPAARGRCTLGSQDRRREHARSR